AAFDSAAEDGESTGVSVTFDVWDNGGTDTAPAIDLRLNGQVIAFQSMDGARTGGRAPAGAILTNSAGGLVALATAPPASFNPNATNFVDVQIDLFGDNTMS